MGYIRRETEYTGEGRNRVPTHRYYLELATWDDNGEIPIATKSRFLEHMPERIEIPSGRGWEVFSDCWATAVDKSNFTVTKG